MNHNKKRLPLDAAVAIALMLIILIQAFYGVVVQKLSADALRWPVFVFAVALAAGAAEIIRSLTAQKKADAAAMKAGKEPAAAPVFTNKKNFLVVCAMIVAYGLLINVLGFIVATSLFAIGFVLYFKFAHIVWFSVTAVATSVVLYFCFTRLMYIHLPVGLLFEHLF